MMKISVNEINLILYILDVQMEAYKKLLHEEFLYDNIKPADEQIYKSLLKLYKKFNKVKISVKKS